MYSFTFETGFVGQLSLDMYVKVTTEIFKTTHTHTASNPQ